eukprot:tig00000113_g5619.t1
MAQHWPILERQPGRGTTRASLADFDAGLQSYAAGVIAARLAAVDPEGLVRLSLASRGVCALLLQQQKWFQNALREPGCLDLAAAVSPQPRIYSARLRLVNWAVRRQYLSARSVRVAMLTDGGNPRDRNDKRELELLLQNLAPGLQEATLVVYGVQDPDAHQTPLPRIRALLQTLQPAAATLASLRVVVDPSVDRQHLRRLALESTCRFWAEALTPFAALVDVDLPSHNLDLAAYVICRTRRVSVQVFSVYKETVGWFDRWARRPESAYNRPGGPSLRGITLVRPPQGLLYAPETVKELFWRVDTCGRRSPWAPDWRRRLEWLRFGGTAIVGGGEEAWLPERPAGDVVDELLQPPASPTSFSHLRELWIELEVASALRIPFALPGLLRLRLALPGGAPLPPALLDALAGMAELQELRATALKQPSSPPRPQPDPPALPPPQIRPRDVPRLLRGALAAPRLARLEATLPSGAWAGGAGAEADPDALSEVAGLAARRGLRFLLVPVPPGPSGTAAGAGAGASIRLLPPSMAQP